MARIPLFVALALALSAPAGAQSAGTPTAALAEANSTFTYGGAPINPRAVQELGTWLSDGGPGPVAIDLASQNSNRYFGKFARDKDGLVTIDLKTAGLSTKPDDNPGYFHYKRLGTLTNGVHVLETWSNGGGSGVFTDLLLIRFSNDFEYTESGAREDRLVMTRLGEFGLGDRYGGTVTVKGDAIEISASGETKKRTVHIK